MKKLKIVLADVPMYEVNFNFYFPTMGILYLMGALKKQCNNSIFEIVYLKGNMNMKKHLETVKKLKPDIYGISFKTPMARLAYYCINKVKLLMPNCQVICGGSHPSLMPNEILEQTKIDVVFRGECESTFPEYINRIFLNKKYFDIPGISYWKDNKIVSNALNPFVENLDSLPLPDWDAINPSDYTGMPYRKGKPYLGVVVSRGCPFKCTFCSEPIWKIFGKPSFRARSIHKIMEEIEQQVKNGVHELRLWCEEFNTNAKWSKELLTSISDKNYKNVYFNFNIRGDVMDDEMADLMKKANVWMVTMGIESSSNRVLIGVQKKVTIEQIENTCKILAKRGIKISGYFQFFNVWESNNKLETETFKEVIATLTWAIKKTLKGELHYMFTAFSKPILGTPLWQIAAKHDLFIDDPNRPLAYLTAQMQIPHVTPVHLFIIRIASIATKGLVALKSGHINSRLILHVLTKSIKRISGNKYENGY